MKTSRTAEVGSQRKRVTQQEGTTMTSHVRQVFFPKDLKPGDEVLLEYPLYADDERLGNATEFVSHGEHYKFLGSWIGRPYFLNLRTDTAGREVAAGVFTILRVKAVPPAALNMNHDPDEDVEHDEEVYRQAYATGGYLPNKREEAKERVRDVDRKVELVTVREDQWNERYQFDGKCGFTGNNLYNAITKALRDGVDCIEIRGTSIPIDGLQQAYITETGMPDIKVTIERKS